MAIAEAQPDGSRVLHLSRRFAAPRERVFRALTEAEQLVKWWGPKGFTVPEHSLDLRPGGAWRTVMRSPEGDDSATVYERNADTASASAEDDPADPSRRLSAAQLPAVARW